MAPNATDDFVEMRITARAGGHDILTVQIRQNGGPDGDGTLSTSYGAGSIEPYLAYWRSVCPQAEAEVRS